MVEEASLNGSSQTTLEERFSALEAKFAALEKNYHALQEKVSVPTESSIDKSTETSADPVHSTTNVQNILITENGLISTASVYQWNHR